jgi:hypothetical protein
MIAASASGNTTGSASRRHMPYLLVSVGRDLGKDVDEPLGPGLVVRGFDRAARTAAVSSMPAALIVLNYPGH